MMSAEPFITTIIKSPFIPFWGLIPSKTQIGTCVIIKGRVPRYADKFAFNFIVGEELSDHNRDFGDIALHFNPHFDDDGYERGFVVKNTRIKNRWGVEEKQRKDFPFVRNQWFEVKFRIEESFYTISVNGQHFGLYLHRIPFIYVGILSIDGDVEIESVRFGKEPLHKYIGDYREENNNATDSKLNKYKPISKSSTPRENHIEIKHQIDHNFNVYASHQSVVDNMVLAQKTLYNPSVPFAHSFINGLRSGMVIVINGLVKDSANKFVIRFQDGPSSYGTPDVGLHFGVRFDRKYIISKCRLNGKWDKREKSPLSSPFNSPKHKEIFEIKFKIDSNKFTVFVNGNYFTKYVSLLKDLELMNVLEIEGDLDIMSIRFDSFKLD